jgi:hypothetical protein
MRADFGALMPVGWAGKAAPAESQEPRLRAGDGHWDRIKMDDRGVINIAASSPNFVLQSLGNPRLGCVRALGLIHELCRTHGHEHEERERSHQCDTGRWRNGS